VVWYRSLYWRIAVGFVALMACLLGAQALLVLWLTGQGGWLPGRSPADVGRLIASDVASALSANPGADVAQHLRERYGRTYRPFVVVLADGRVITGRQGPPLPGMLRAAYVRLQDAGIAVAPPRGAPFPEPGRGAPAPAAVPPEEPGAAGPQPFAPLDGRVPGGGQPPRPRETVTPIEVKGRLAGVVVVASGGPQIWFLLQAFGSTLALIGLALLLAGAAVASLVIFRPARERMRKLEEAAVALGAGRTSVRAPADGDDEVSALARAFNRMAAALEESHAARRRLLADVSHELRTPLTAIRGYVETLGMADLPLDADTRARYLRIVDDETQKLETLVGDLLDVARLEGGGAPLALARVPVAGLFERVADRHGVRMREKTVSLRTDIEPGAEAVHGDPDRLEQALQNLAANAVRHTPEGGEILLRAEPAGDHVRIAVRDTGPGIAPEHLPHVFDRFYKADASRSAGDAAGGSGLGLSIVKAIVERHGGAVTAANAPEGGAVFEILLPAART